MYKSIIDSNNKGVILNVSEIWRFRQLLFSLALRDIKVRYAQTYIGILWAFINPIINLAILGFVFGKVAKVDSGNIPHLLFTAVGLCGWTYFSTLLSEAGNSIVGAQSMVKKIYFPRLIIPLSKAISGMIDLGIIFLCLFGLMLYYGKYPGENIIYIPLFILIAVLSGLAVGILFSALTIRYRDFSFIIPMFVRLGMFITPIAYSSSEIPQNWKFIYFLNPMAGVVEGLRWSFFSDGPFDLNIIYSIGVMLCVLVAALFYFSRIERVMADII